MKTLVLLFMAACFLIADEIPPEGVKKLQKLIRAYGYRCDTVDNKPAFSPWDGSVKVVCNNFKYVYEVKDVGGNWTVTVK